MSDEHIIDDPPIDETTQSSDDWVMPEPIFRTSEGRTPKAPQNPFYTDDIPTEIANKEDLAIEKARLDAKAAQTDVDVDPIETEQDPIDAPADSIEIETELVDSESDTLETETDKNESKEVAVPEKTPQAPPKAKGGCAKNFLFILLMIGLAAAVAVVALIYLAPDLVPNIFRTSDPLN